MSTVRPGPHWHDWGASVSLHGLALGALLALGLAAPTVLPEVRKLDLAMQWERPADVAAVAPPPPEPAPPVVRPPTPTPQPVRPAPTPPQAAPMTPAAQVLATHADTVVTPAPAPVAEPVTAAPTVTAPPVAAAPPAPAVDPGAERRWQAVFESLLLRHKHYPISARRARQEGVVTVEAHFAPDGALLQCAIQVGSGFDVLDDAALALVQRAAVAAKQQLAPGRKARLSVPVTFNLEDT